VRPCSREQRLASVSLESAIRYRGIDNSLPLAVHATFAAPHYEDRRHHDRHQHNKGGGTMRDAQAHGHEMLLQRRGSEQQRVATRRARATCIKSWTEQ